jgi:hypothetical protein
MMFDQSQVRIRGHLLSQSPEKLGANPSFFSISNLQKPADPPSDHVHQADTSKREFGNLKVQMLPCVELAHILRAHATKTPLDTVVLDVLDPAFPTAHRTSATLFLSDVVVTQATQKPGSQLGYPALDGASKDPSRLGVGIPTWGKPPLMHLTEIELTFRKVHRQTR